MGHVFARPLSRIAACAAALTICMAGGAGAQSYEDFQHRAVAPAPALAPSVGNPFVKPGPVIYVCDNSGQLATITLGTYTVHRIGYGVALTDIAFNPKDGHLYGVDFSNFYRINTANAAATYIGSLGISDANALVFSSSGEAYTSGVNTGELYSINIKTGRATGLGSTSPFRSAGDLTFYNGDLVESGYDASSLGSTTPDYLVDLNLKTGKPLSYAKLAIANLYGLVSTGKNLMYGFAGTDVYELYPNASTAAKRAVLLKKLTNTGLGQIYGAAYNGYFQN